MSWTERDLRPAGFFACRVLARPDWLPAPQIECVCTASQCSAEWPTGWMEHWLHNDLWLYDTLENVATVVAGATNGPFHTVYARILPVLFTEDGDRPLDGAPCMTRGGGNALDLQRLRPAPMPPGFVKLGYEVLQWDDAGGPSCSALICNHRAVAHPANRCGLLDELAPAIAEARLCAAADGKLAEPGPYVVMELWCDRQPTPSGPGS